MIYAAHGVRRTTCRYPNYFTLISNGNWTEWCTIRIEITEGKPLAKQIKISVVKNKLAWAEGRITLKIHVSVWESNAQRVSFQNLAIFHHKRLSLLRRLLTTCMRTENKTDDFNVFSLVQKVSDVKYV